MVNMLSVNIQRSKFLLLSLLIILIISGCKKALEVEAPVTNTNAANVYSSDATATAVLTGIYAKMSNLNFDLTGNNGLGITSVSLFAGLSVDEITLHNLSDPGLLQYYRNDLTPLTESGLFWSSIYPVIFVANAAIEGLNSSSGATPAVRQQLLGEAKFIRAFLYFYLVNMYGDVPLVTTTDYEVNKTLPRESRNKVYQQIIADLKDAQSLLSNAYLKADFVTPTAERIRPVKWAATAMLARAYLYTSDWVNAEIEASSVIDGSAFSLDTLNGVFLINSKESIWQLQPVRTGINSNTGEGALFILPASGPNTTEFPVYLSNTLLNNFETGDQRKVLWIDSVKPAGKAYYYPKKYKIGKVNTNTKEYIMMLRLAEQYLIRAEARAQQNKIAEALNDVKAIRSRANLVTPSSIDKSALLAMILHERQVELFTEWGHRWFDLKRTGNIDAVMNSIIGLKGGVWNSNKTLYPIPQKEINLDGNLSQNIGY